MKKRNDETLVKRLLNVSWMNDKKDPAFYSWSKLNFDGKVYNAFQNGYYIFAATDDFGYYETKQTKLDSFFKQFADRPQDFACLNELNVSLVSRQEKESKALYKDFGKVPAYIETADGKAVAYNPEYMKDCLEFFGDGSAYINVSDMTAFNSFDCYVKPIMFKSADGKKVGLLMPVNAMYGKKVA